VDRRGYARALCARQIGGLLRGAVLPSANGKDPPLSVAMVHRRRRWLFVAKTSNERPVLFIYYGEDVARRSITKLLTRDAARRIAADIAKLPDLVQWLSKGVH
jgi:hypothetical protein